MTVGNAVVFAGGLYEIEHGLKLTDNSHISIDADKILIGEIGLFILYGLGVLVDGNILEFNKSRLASFARIDVL